MCGSSSIVGNSLLQPCIQLLLLLPMHSSASAHYPEDVCPLSRPGLLGVQLHACHRTLAETCGSAPHPCAGVVHTNNLPTYHPDKDRLSQTPTQSTKEELVRAPHVQADVLHSSAGDLGVLPDTSAVLAGNRPGLSSPGPSLPLGNPVTRKPGLPMPNPSLGDSFPDRRSAPRLRGLNSGSTLSSLPMRCLGCPACPWAMRSPGASHAQPQPGRRLRRPQASFRVR